MTIELDGQLYQILEFQHIKLGRGSAQVRMKLRNVRRGDTIEKTVQAGDRFTRARLDHRSVQFLYRDGSHFHFKDTVTYDQLILADGMVVVLEEYEGDPIGVELPASVALRITRSETGLRGDTAQGAMKPAVLETGLRVNVPLFVNEGDRIKVDTRTGEYLERVQG